MLAIKINRPAHRTAAPGAGALGAQVCTIAGPRLSGAQAAGGSQLANERNLCAGQWKYLYLYIGP
jgi:hypothetical protein